MKEDQWWDLPNQCQKVYQSYPSTSSPLTLFISPLIPVLLDKATPPSTFIAYARCRIYYHNRNSCSNRKKASNESRKYTKVRKLVCLRRLPKTPLPMLNFTNVNFILKSKFLNFASIPTSTYCHFFKSCRQQTSIRDDNRTHPDQADQDFMAGLLPLLRMVLQPPPPPPPLSPPVPGLVSEFGAWGLITEAGLPFK